MQEILHGNPFPLLLRMAAPNTVAFFVQAIVSMVEVWYIGQLGSSLAAMALVFPLPMLMQMMAGGALGGAVNSAIARAMGAARRDRVDLLTCCSAARTRCSPSRWTTRSCSGLLSSLSPIITVVTIVCVTGLVARFGVAALAGYGIGSRLEFLMTPRVSSLGTAMTSMVGINVGAGNYDHAECIGWLGGSTAAAVAWPVIATILRFVAGVGGAVLAVFTFDLGLTAIYICISIGLVLYGAVTAGAIGLGAWRPR